MRRRPFAGDADAGLLQDFTARAIADQGRAGLIHPGDVTHRIYNGLRRDDPRDLVHVWEDAGRVLGWTLLDPRGAGFDPQVSNEARRRYPALEEEIVIWSEEQLLTLMRDRDSDATYVETDAFVNDPNRSQLLVGLGWVPQDVEVMWLARRPLETVAPPRLPDGYAVRTVHGIEEAGQVADLHAAGFGSAWTPELYASVMSSPGYKADREFVVEASDGSLAAFCVTWPDSVNRVGLFEPVAVHPDHRRLGLGRAVMRAGMEAMRSWGMRFAEVMYDRDNPGSGPLYRSEGFVPVEEIILYRKPVAGGTQ